MGDVAREIAYDNLATAVAESEGNLVRFNPRFLSLARECGFIPRACHVRAPWEKAQASHCTPLAGCANVSLCGQVCALPLCLPGRSSAGGSYKHCPLSL